MKVLHLISGGDTGGAKTHIINLIEALQNQIYVKTICFIKEDFYFEAKEKGINIELFYQKKRYDISVIKRLISEIKKEEYDIIHSHGARANFITFLIKLFYKIPSVSTIHSDYTLDFKGDFYKNLVYSKLNSFSLRFMNYYIGVSQSFTEMLIDRKFDKNKIFTVYNGIDLSSVHETTNRDDFLNSHNIKFDKDTIVVGILARLHPVKGIDIFLNGAKKVLESNKNVIFLIAGDGQDKDKLEALSHKLGIKNKVYFLGFIDKQFDFLNALDINALTSHSESFPYVILEGALLKKPIVSSHVGGIEDMVIENKTGFLFDSGNSEEFAYKLNKLIENKNLRNTIGKNLFEFVSNNFSSKHMAKSHMNIYKQILKG